MDKYAAVVVALTVLPAAVRADSPVLFGTARVQDGPQAAGFLGTHQAGLALTAAKFGGELAFAYFDRRLELRGGWRTDLLLAGPLFLSWRASGAVFGGFAPFDLGAGVFTGVSTGFGGDPFEVFAGAEVGVETRLGLLFALPVRGVAGVRLRADLFDLSAQARVTTLPLGSGLSRIEGLLVLARLL